MQKNIPRRIGYFFFGGILATVVLAGSVSVSSNGEKYLSHDKQTSLTVLSPDDSQLMPTETPTPSATPIIQKVATKQVTKPAPTRIPSPSPEFIQATPTSVLPTVPVTPSEPYATPYDAWFDQYSVTYNIDRQTLVNIARCESGFNPQATNGPYDGMYQFHAGTWHSTRTAMGENPDADLRFNPEEAIKTAAWKIAHGGIGAWPVCGRG
ncbi:transglycosylase SLT domain-containing protein [Candidatus Roizmanbacteria bacterium]|nr:transglycosylase SLT domain-containing protein [Candidatus Roizmanbacteria bacterium]